MLRQLVLLSSFLLLCQCAGGVGEATCGVDDEQCLQNDRGSAENKITDEDCVDEHELCRDWAKEGECTSNPSYMLNACRRSCNVCEYELKASDFGKPQRIPAHRSREVQEIVRRSEVYMAEVRNDPEYQSILDECHNIDERCSMWALDDGCEDNPSYSETFEL